MQANLELKLKKLRKNIRKLDSALVALSGGADSSFLMRICREELGNKSVAVTIVPSNYPSGDIIMAKRVAKILGVKHVVHEMEETEEPPSSNICRGANMYSCLKSLAMNMKIKNVLDGSHADDLKQGAVSFTAAKRAGFKSPLLESQLSKAEIRLLAKELGLPNWDKKPKTNKKQNTKSPSGKFKNTLKKSSKRKNSKKSNRKNR